VSVHVYICVCACVWMVVSEGVGVCHVSCVCTYMVVRVGGCGYVCVSVSRHPLRVVCVTALRTLTKRVVCVTPFDLRVVCECV